MSEETKEKSTGKSAHRKKKGKKVKSLSFTWVRKQHGVTAWAETQNSFLDWKKRIVVALLALFFFRQNLMVYLKNGWLFDHCN